MGIQHFWSYFTSQNGQGFPDMSRFVGPLGTGDILGPPAWAERWAQELRAVLALARTGSGLAPWMFWLRVFFLRQWKNMERPGKSPIFFGWFSHLNADFVAFMGDFPAMFDDFDFEVPQAGSGHWQCRCPCALCTQRLSAIARRACLGSFKEGVSENGDAHNMVIWLDRKHDNTPSNLCSFEKLLGSLGLEPVSAWDGGRPHWSGSTEVGGPGEFGKSIRTRVCHGVAFSLGRFDSLNGCYGCSIRFFIFNVSNAADSCLVWWQDAKLFWMEGLGCGETYNPSTGQLLGDIFGMVSRQPTWRSFWWEKLLESPTSW